MMMKTTCLISDDSVGLSDIGDNAENEEELEQLIPPLVMRIWKKKNNRKNQDSIHASGAPSKKLYIC